MPSYGVFTPVQDNDKTNVEPLHSYDAFHTWFVGPGVKGIIGMHRFNIRLVVVLLSCSGVKIPLVVDNSLILRQMAQLPWYNTNTLSMKRCLCPKPTDNYLIRYLCIPT